MERRNCNVILAGLPLVGALPFFMPAKGDEVFANHSINSLIILLIR